MITITVLLSSIFDNNNNITGRFWEWVWRQVRPLVYNPATPVRPASVPCHSPRWLRSETAKGLGLERSYFVCTLNKKLKKITPQKWPCCCHADPCRPWNAIPHPWLGFISGCPQRKISFVIWKCDDCQNLKKKIQKAKTYRLRQAFPKEWYLWKKVDFLEQEWTAVQISLNKSKVVQYPWWRANCLLSKYPETRMHRWIILDEDNP